MHSKTRLLAPPRVVLCILASIMMYIRSYFIKCILSYVIRTKNKCAITR